MTLPWTSSVAQSDGEGLIRRLGEMAQEAKRSAAGEVPSPLPEPGSIEAAYERIENLETALLHHTTIGQATGLVMERFDVSADAAMDVLKRLSQHHNRKVYDIARELLATGRSEGL